MAEDKTYPAPDPHTQAVIHEIVENLPKNLRDSGHAVASTGSWLNTIGWTGIAVGVLLAGATFFGGIPAAFAVPAYIVSAGVGAVGGISKYFGGIMNKPLQQVGGEFDRAVDDLERDPALAHEMEQHINRAMAAAPPSLGDKDIAEKAANHAMDFLQYKGYVTEESLTNKQDWQGRISSEQTPMAGAKR